MKVKDVARELLAVKRRLKEESDKIDALVNALLDPDEVVTVKKIRSFSTKETASTLINLDFTPPSKCWKLGKKEASHRHLAEFLKEVDSSVVLPLEEEEIASVSAFPRGRSAELLAKSSSALPSSSKIFPVATAPAASPTIDITRRKQLAVLEALNIEDEDPNVLFDMFDEDDNGFIDNEELSFVLQRFGIMMDDVTIRQLMGRYNKERRDMDRKKHMCCSPLQEPGEAGLNRHEFKTMFRIQQVGLGEEGLLHQQAAKEEGATVAARGRTGVTRHAQCVARFKGYWHTFSLVASGQFIHEPESTFAVRWTLITMMWILQSALVIPARLGFDSKPSALTSMLDYASELWFLVDIWMNFHIGYLDSDTG
jgi:hypothetical protein